MGKNTLSSPRVILGIILIVLGGLFLMDNYGIFYFELPDFLFHWQMIFIIIGLVILITAHNKTAGVIFLAIGLLNYLPELWPLILVAVGFAIIYRRGGYRRSTAHGSDETNPNNTIDETINDISIFGGGTKVFHSDNFKGGNIVAIFGGSEIRLTECKLAEGENVLELTALFGGSTILVPRDWNVRIDILPVFGGFGDKRIKDPNLVFDNSRTLMIKGIVLFGGGEIKSF